MGPPGLRFPEEAGRCCPQETAKSPFCPFRRLAWRMEHAPMRCFGDCDAGAFRASSPGSLMPFPENHQAANSLNGWLPLRKLPFKGGRTTWSGCRLWRSCLPVITGTLRICPLDAPGSTMPQTASLPAGGATVQTVLRKEPCGQLHLQRQCDISHLSHHAPGHVPAACRTDGQALCGLPQRLRVQGGPSRPAVPGSCDPGFRGCLGWALCAVLLRRHSGEHGGNRAAVPSGRA